MAEVDWEVLWWMLWIGAAGACVGSFGNMLVYRLPRERSLIRPLHSYCPECEVPIRWYDNLPLVSYLLLGGRCRVCSEPIPLRYPLIEGLCALGFMLVVDAFYVGAVRPDLQSPEAFGITGQVAASWPLLVGHLVMVACLLAVAVMDLEEYYVDVRLTWFIAGVGLAVGLTNGLCTPQAPPMSATTAGITVAATAGLLLSWAVVRRRARLGSGTGPDDARARGPQPAAEPARGLVESPTEPPEELIEVGACDGEVPVHGAVAETAARETPGRPSPAWGCLVAALGLAAVLAWAACVSLGGIERPAWPSTPARLALALVISYAALVASSIRSRPADAEIVQAIESERSGARRLAFGELMYRLPAVLLGASAWWWLSRGQGHRAAEVLAAMLAWPGTTAWQPLRGLLWVILAMLVAGGIGWAVRIFFTLVLGKEALGLGDVHIMWAAAAVVGWAVVVLGFFAAAFLAVTGMILLLGFKRSRAIPFGPWLALGLLLVVLGREPILTWLRPAIEAFAELLTRTTN